MVDDDQCTTAWAVRTLGPLALDSSRLQQMSVAATALGRRDADERLADLVVQAATTGRNAQ